MKEKAQFIQNLEMGVAQTLVVYGTSLSFHLAPLLRSALVAHYGEIANVLNAGMAAKASRSGLLELEGRVLSRVPDALLLEFAVNDAYDYSDFPPSTPDKGISLQESRDNLEALIDKVQIALPRCEIILQTMNPTYDSASNEAKAGSRRPKLEAYYEGYRSVAAARSLKLIDHTLTWKALRAEDEARFQELIPDGAHPTPTALRSVLVPHLLTELGITAKSSSVF